MCSQSNQLKKKKEFTWEFKELTLTKLPQQFKELPTRNLILSPIESRSFWRLNKALIWKQIHMGVSIVPKAAKDDII